MEKRTNDQLIPIREALDRGFINFKAITEYGVSHLMFREIKAEKIIVINQNTGNPISVCGNRMVIPIKR